MLGWDNREKLSQLDEEQDNLHHLINRQQQDLQQLEADLQRLHRDTRILESLLSTSTFHEIDWRTRQSEYDYMQNHLAELKQDSQQLVYLEQQSERLQKEIREAEKRRDKITGEIRSLSDLIKHYQQQRQQAENRLNSLNDPLVNLWQQVSSVLAEADAEPLTIDTISNRTQELEISIQRSISTFRGYQGRFESTITNAMNTFRYEYPDEGASLTANIDSLSNFERIYYQLQNDGLPVYEERFKQMLDRTVTHGVRVFSAHLDDQERKIDHSIAELNDSLAQVDYGGGSIIRLIAERTRDPEINEFRRELRACIPNAGDNSQEELKRAYDRIKALITRLDHDTNWMQRVINVRNWRVFAAEQLNTEGRQIDYYSDSSGKSGGQKAKLAYTILASAIAHQYGLSDSSPSDRTFRFVVIDEAFSKLDDENARYAMKLFNQLGLQLMVVTPMQQLHVIEDYTQAYHLVINNGEGSESRLFNLTQSQYREHRREFLAREKWS